MVRVVRIGAGCAVVVVLVVAGVPATLAAFEVMVEVVAFVVIVALVVLAPAPLYLCSQPLRYHVTL